MSRTWIAVAILGVVVTVADVLRGVLAVSDLDRPGRDARRRGGGMDLVSG